MAKNFRASHLGCALGYRHNDIIVLIIGKPNKDNDVGFAIRYLRGGPMPKLLHFATSWLTIFLLGRTLPVLCYSSVM